uniref:Uncharacterized protein n=1 Tax=Tanacetum cinerariifolium TaxID=118510 RepID=A0A699JK58_TANCI|nr:hypothetical protein [Tanacetum cinerariifolium]
MAPIPLRVHLAAVFEPEAMEEAHWGSFYRRNSMELTERIRQRDDAIANIQAMVVESDHRLRRKRWAGGSIFEDVGLYLYVDLM